MDGIKLFIENNQLVAFVIIVGVYAMGDVIGTASKAWIPSTFVIACLFLLGYWTIFPKEIIAIAGLKKPLIGTLSLFLLVTHMGTTISLKELKKQWKIIVVTLTGLVGMVVFAWVICSFFIEKSYIIAGLPSLAGGIVAAVTMQEAAASKGMEVAAVLAIAMYSIQGFVGYPLTAIILKKEGNRLIKDYREGNPIESEVELIEKKSERKKIIKPTPDKYFSTAVALTKLAIIATLAMFIGQWTGGWGYFKINGIVAALIMGIVFTEIGFLEKDILKKCGCFNLIALFVMLYIFDGLKGASIEILSSAIFPMVSLIGFGVSGMGIVSIIVSRALKISPLIGIGASLTALYGFPPNFVLTNEASNAIAKDEEEKEYLMKHMLPQMIVGGFVTVTITSVIIAGIFANLL